MMTCRLTNLHCRDHDCKGKSVTFPHPGIEDFNTVSPNINDQISSYRCRV